jgi:hypothetical protein
LNGGSARRKAAIYTQNNTNAEYTHTDIHASSGIRTYDPSVRAGEDVSYLRPRGHCDRRFVCIDLCIYRNIETAIVHSSILLLYKGKKVNLSLCLIKHIMTCGGMEVSRQLRAPAALFPDKSPPVRSG